MTLIHVIHLYDIDWFLSLECVTFCHTALHYCDQIWLWHIRSQNYFYFLVTNFHKVSTGLPKFVTTMIVTVLSQWCHNNLMSQYLNVTIVSLIWYLENWFRVFNYDLFWQLAASQRGTQKLKHEIEWNYLLMPGQTPLIITDLHLARKFTQY